MINIFVDIIDSDYLKPDVKAGISEVRETMIENVRIIVEEAKQEEYLKCIDHNKVLPDSDIYEWFQFYQFLVLFDYRDKKTPEIWFFDLSKIPRNEITDFIGNCDIDISEDELDWYYENKYEGEKLHQLVFKSFYFVPN